MVNSDCKVTKKMNNLVRYIMFLRLRMQKNIKKQPSVHYYYLTNEVFFVILHRFSA